MKEHQVIKEIGADGISFYLSLGPRAHETFKIDAVREDFERAFFCAKRTLDHLKHKNHDFHPLEVRRL